MSTIMDCYNKKKRVVKISNQCNSKSLTPQKKTLSDLVKDYLKYYDNYYTFQEQWWGDKNMNWEGALCHFSVTMRLI
ncbi:MAG: hypothetical protein F6K39_08885 [Okeania sp. SIO3B3]|nr:hypothetical protein [Okeania sp. SIO3B3]